MKQEELIISINKNLDTTIEEGVSDQELRKQLAGYIQHLIDTDFNRLIFLLYRVDVSEVKLKNTLEQDNAERTADVIAELIIERISKKIKTREMYRNQQPGSDEEKL